MKNYIRIFALIFAFSCSQGIEEKIEPGAFPLNDQRTPGSEAFCLSGESRLGSENHKNLNKTDLRGRESLSACGNCSGDNYVVNAKFWIIRKSNGTGGVSSSSINTAKSILNNSFNNLNISFNYQSIGYINDDWLYYPQSMKWGDPSNMNYTANLFSIIGKPGSTDRGAAYRSDNRIDIFILPDGGHEGAGLAKKINDDFPGNAFAIAGSRNGASLFPTEVLTHEMAHCLGLYHTDDKVGGEELVYGDGTNKQNTGDLIKDTPAAPENVASYISANCVYSCTGCKDANGYSYVNVPVSNVMTPKNFVNCLTNQLSTGQERRIKDNLISSSTLAPLVSTSNSCSFSNWILSGTPFGNISSGSTVYYKVKENGSSSNISPNPRPVIRVSSSGAPVNVTYGGLSYTVQANSFLDIEIDGTLDCLTNPSINAHMAFYRLMGFNPSVTVQLLSVSGNHTKSSSTHSFSVM